MLAQLAPRLLKKEDAARYCGIDAARFQRVCPVRPVRLDGKVRRWDVRALDRWLDGLAKTPESMSEEDWLEELRGHGAGSEKDVDDGARQGD